VESIESIDALADAVGSLTVSSAEPAASTEALLGACGGSDQSFTLDFLPQVWQHSFSLVSSVIETY
jgi:hypothetical protein